MEDRWEYFTNRKSLGCSNCRTRAKVDAISQLCSSCKKHLLLHGSASIPKPSLKSELKEAYLRVTNYCNTNQATEAFDRFMISYASPSKSDPLKRLCWLHFIQLKASDGDPLMRFEDTLVQALAVTIYEENGGRLDNRKNQYQYLLGRASICPWNRKRKSGKGAVYNKAERAELQRKPTVFHRAFQEIFLRAGLVRFLSQLKHQITKASS